MLDNIIGRGYLPAYCVFQTYMQIEQKKMENLIFFLPFFAAIAIAVISHKVLRLEQSEKEQQLIQLLETKMTKKERKEQPEKSEKEQRIIYFLDLLERSAAQIERLENKIVRIEQRQNIHNVNEQVEPQVEPDLPFAYDPPELYHNNKYWKLLSEWYRNESNWECEACELDLSYYPHRKYLDVHHVRGKSYNDPKDLKALCVGCHAKQTEPIDHSFMKDDRRYKQFRKVYPDWTE